MVRKAYEGYGKMTKKPNKFDAVESYKARFNGLAIESKEAREFDDKMGSWDSDRDLTNARNRVDSILDEYNHYRMGKEIDLVEVPDFPPDEIVYTSEPLDGKGTE